MDEKLRLVEAILSLARPMDRPNAEWFVRVLPEDRVQYWLREAWERRDPTAFLVNRLSREALR